MGRGPQRYRKKPFAVFEHGTRIYAPSAGEDRFRVVATDAAGGRVSYKFRIEPEARAKAREIESFLAAQVPLRARPDQPRTVGTLGAAYLGHLEGRSPGYRDRQASILRSWLLPRLGDITVGEWTPAMSEVVLADARRRCAPSTVQNIGSCMRALVTFAHKSRWLPRDADPMWLVSYSLKAEFQGEANGFVPRDALPDDAHCTQFFDALVQLGEPTWALAMRLKHRCGARWGELIGLRPCDLEFEPHRVVRIHRAVVQSRLGRSIATTKNKQKRSSIFPASLAADLRRHSDDVRQSRGDEALLFENGDGQPAEHRKFHRLWVRAAKEAGWPMKSRTVAQWHPHDLRHVAACWMLFDVRLDPAVVSRMLGHANPAFTLSRYVGVRVGADATTHALTDSW